MRCSSRAGRLRALLPTHHRSPAIVLAAEEATHGLSRHCLHRRRHMGIQVQGDADLAMAEQVTHDLGMHPLAEQQRGAAMPQVMEPDTGQTSASKQRKKAPLPQIVRVERPADGIGKDQAMLLPADPCCSRSAAWRP
jgi:hypothetical protein